MKKILILAGAPSHEKVVETAKEMNLHTIVTDYLPVEESPSKAIADEYLMYDINDVDNIIKYCKDNNVDAVAGLAIDPSQKPFCQITTELNMRNFGSNDFVELFTNKQEFQNFCKINNFEIIKNYSIEDVANNNVQYPIIIKPINSRASRGVIKCNNRLEVEEAIKVASSESSDKKSFIIQRYIENAYNITAGYIIKNGEPKLFKIGDIHCGLNSEKMDRQFTAIIHPSMKMDYFVNNINSKVINLLKKSGLKNAVVLLQGFLEGEKYMIYDPGLRFGGTEYERVFNVVNNLNPVKNILDYLVNGEISDFDKYDDSYKLNDKVSYSYYVTLKPGKIKKIIGLEDIRKRKSTVIIHSMKHEGDTVIEKNGHKQFAICIYCAFPRNVDIIRQELEYIETNLKIVDENDNNMMYSTFLSKDFYKKYSKFWK